MTPFPVTSVVTGRNVGIGGFINTIDIEYVLW